MLKPSFLALTIALTASLTARAQHQHLRDEIAQISHSASGKVGVAIRLLEINDTLSYHSHSHYVMQSVFKFPVAMAVLHQVDGGKLKLEQKIHVAKADLPETVSALRDKYPQGDVDVAIRELLTDMVTVSDNDACDILIKLLGGPQQVDHYLHSIGVQNIHIAVNEAEMAATWPAQYTNWCEPSAQVELLTRLYRQTALSRSSNDLLRQLMLNTFVGPKRIRGLLPPGTAVAHRTGTSGTNPQGLSPGTNDVGIITLPNGRHLAIAILLTDSYADAATRDSVIARIAKAAYGEFEK